MMKNDQPPSTRLADAARLFNGRRLTLARQLAGLRKNGLAERIGKTPTAVAAYECGTKRPAPSTVAQLSLTLGVDPTFFMVGHSDDTILQTPHFRSLRSTTQVVRDQAHAYACLVHDIASTIERYVELPASDVPRYSVLPDEPISGDAEAAAAKIRAEWRVPAGPVGHSMRQLEARGILIVFSVPQAVSVDAFSIDGDLRPLILLNPAKDNYFRQRFDIAHELGHIVMHFDAEPGNSVAEDQANRFAAEFLMPEAEIADELPAKADWQRLMALKERWGVSLQALLMRSRQLKVMSEQTYQRAMVSLTKHGWRRHEPGDGIATEQPSMLARSVELLEEAGYDTATLASECRVPIEVFRLATSRRPNFAWQTGPGGSHLHQPGAERLPSGVADLSSFRRQSDGGLTGHGAP